MALQVMIIVLGTVAAIAYIVHCFITGDKNQETIKRDRNMEKDALAQSPTVNKVTDKIGDVSIIDNEEDITVSNYSIEEDKESTFTSNVNTTNNIDNVTNENSTLEKVENVTNVVSSSVESQTESKVAEELVSEQVETSDENSNEPSQGLFSKCFSKFGSLFKSSNTSEKEEVLLEDNYYFNLKSKDDKGVSAREMAEFCDNVGLQIDSDYIFFNKDEENRSIFGVCGNSEPYGFDPLNSDNVNYEIINIFMNLPERGLAESYFLQTAQFAYLLTQQLDLVLVNNQGEEMTTADFQSYVESIQEQLIKYDNNK